MLYLDQEVEELVQLAPGCHLLDNQSILLAGKYYTSTWLSPAGQSFNIVGR